MNLNVSKGGVMGWLQGKKWKWEIVELQYQNITNQKKNSYGFDQTWKNSLNSFIFLYRHTPNLLNLLFKFLILVLPFVSPFTEKTAYNCKFLMNEYP